MSKISVIIPVYNAEEFLSECLNSVLEQTHQNFEIICVNDGSTDGSLNILNSWALYDKRIKIINQENQGQSAARNKGLDVARGKYIFFLDSDDFIHPQTLEAAHYWAEKNKTPITAFLYEKEDDICLIKKRSLTPKTKKAAESPENSTFVGCSYFTTFFVSLEFAVYSCCLTVQFPT